MRWCTISDPEQQKCSDMSKAFQEAGIQPSLLCVQGTSADHCVQLITVSPLPSALPRQEGSDSGRSSQQPHSLGKSPKSPCQGRVIGSSEFPWQQGPLVSCPEAGWVLGGPGRALLRAPVEKGV